MERRVDRFDKYMNFKGLNDNKVTLKLSLSVGTLGKSRKKGRDLSDRVIEQILNSYPDLNYVWLMTGEGEMILKQDKEYTIPESTQETIAREPSEHTYLDNQSRLIKMQEQLLQNNTRLMAGQEKLIETNNMLAAQIIELCSKKPENLILEKLDAFSKEIQEFRAESKNAPAREDVGCADVG
jgi:hypothetical protein